MEEYTEEQYEQAKLLISYYRRASVMMINSFVTKKYTPAAQIIHRLEDEGHIGPFDPNGPRKVFIQYAPENNFGAGI